MPHKTKKQKKLAEIHRKMYPLKEQNQSNQEIVNSQIDTKEKTVSHSTGYAYTFNHETIAKPKTQIMSSDYHEIRNDLIRITIFTFLAISFQLVLYFLLYRG